MPLPPFHAALAAALLIAAPASAQAPVRVIDGDTPADLEDLERQIPDDA